MYQGLITIYLLQYIHWCELATNILKSTSDIKLETKKKNYAKFMLEWHHLRSI